AQAQPAQRQENPTTMGHWTKSFLTMNFPVGRGGTGRQTHLPLGARAAGAIAVLLFSTTALWAQAPASDASNAKPDQAACQQAGGSTPSPSQAESQAGKGSGEKKPGGTPEDPCASNSKDESEGK